MTTTWPQLSPRAQNLVQKCYGVIGNPNSTIMECLNAERPLVEYIAELEAAAKQSPVESERAGEFESSTDAKRAAAVESPVTEERAAATEPPVIFERPHAAPAGAAGAAGSQHSAQGGVGAADLPYRSRSATNLEPAFPRAPIDPLADYNVGPAIRAATLWADWNLSDLARPASGPEEALGVLVVEARAQLGRELWAIEEHVLCAGIANHFRNRIPEL